MPGCSPSLPTSVIHLVCVRAQSCPALGDPWTVAHQAPLSMEFSRQEYWSGLPFTSPGDLLTQGSNSGLLHYRWFCAFQADSLPIEPSFMKMTRFVEND